MFTVMIWSSCFEPVPPILNLLGPADFTASMYSLGVLYGVSEFTQRTNWSSAIIETGVRSFQLNGTPVASGVVNRLESVMTILCASPLALFTSRKPSAPAPPGLFTTTIGCFIRLCLATMPWMNRAIWSAPPPGPAGTMNSTVLLGSQANAGASTVRTAPANAATLLRVKSDFIGYLLGDVSMRRNFGLTRRPGRAGARCSERAVRKFSRLGVDSRVHALLLGLLQVAADEDSPEAHHERGADQRDHVLHHRRIRLRKACDCTVFPGHLARHQP